MALSYLPPPSVSRNGCRALSTGAACQSSGGGGNNIPNFSQNDKLNFGIWRKPRVRKQDSVILFKQPRDEPWKSADLSLRHEVTHEAQILRRGFRPNRDTPRRSLEKDNPILLMPRIIPMQDISHDKPICNLLSFKSFFIFIVFLSYRKRRTFLQYLDD